MDENKVKNKSKKGKVLTVSLVMVLLIAVGALGAVCVHLYQKSNEEEVTTTVDKNASGSAIVVSDDNRDLQNQINEKAKDGRIVIKMTQNWIFEDDCTKSNAYIANSERNTTDLRFEISLADTGEVIMTSPDVPVGSCIENFGLNKALAAGGYDVVVAHQQIKDGQIYATVRTSAKITVK